MTARSLPDIVIEAALIQRIGDKDAATILGMFFMSHQRAPFGVDRPGGPFQARMDAAMARLCNLGCVERVEPDQFRIVDPGIRTVAEYLEPLATLSPTWGHA